MNGPSCSYDQAIGDGQSINNIPVILPIVHEKTPVFLHAIDDAMIAAIL